MDRIEATTVPVRRRSVGERSDWLDPRVDVTHEERWRGIRQNLRELALEAGKADKNAYLRIGGKSTLAERITKAIEDTDSLVMEVIQDETLDE